MAYNTNNPLGSNDFRDLSDNAEYFDKYAVGPQPAYPNRFGVLKLSIEGQQQAFLSAQSGRQSQFETQLGAMGYTWVADYGPGLLFTSRNQYMVRDGIPYTVDNSTTLPYTTTGNWATEVSKFKAISVDDILRSELSQGDGATLIGGGVTVVSSVAALRALSLSAPSKFAQPSGYYIAGDGGGGPIRRLVTGQPSGTFVDNGASIIVPTGGNGSSAWLWCHSGPVVIDWYGATTDPLIDNAPFILKAAQNGSTVIIPQGKTYAVSGVEILDKNNFTITGGGTLRLMDLSNKPVLRATRCTSWQFDGVKTDGNKANQNNTADRNLGSCLFAYMSYNWKIINCETINGYSGACILAIDNSGTPTEVQTNGLIGWNIIRDGGGTTAATLCDGIFANSDNTIIVGNTIYNVTDYGIAADYSRNLKIIHNSIRLIGFCGIGVLGAYDWDVSNNRIQQAGLGIAVTLSGNAAVDPYISRDVRISGNIISDITNAGGLLGDAIFVDPSAVDIEISLNKIRNVFRGIACSSINCVVIGNQIRDAEDRGLFVAIAGAVISGNKTLRCASGNYYGDFLSNKTLFEDSAGAGIAVTTLLNNWVNFGGTYDVAAYWRQGNRVTLCGNVKSGASGGAPIFQLPLGYRPKTPAVFAVPADTVGGVAQVSVTTDGYVIHNSGPVTNVQLSAITFFVA